MRICMCIEHGCRNDHARRHSLRLQTSSSCSITKGLSRWSADATTGSLRNAPSTWQKRPRRCARTRAPVQRVCALGRMDDAAHRFGPAQVRSEYLAEMDEMMGGELTHLAPRDGGPGSPQCIQLDGLLTRLCPLLLCVYRARVLWRGRNGRGRR